ncbi:cutinase family protein [Streptomyces sp. NPDC012769]|uniref:cutinase family protein n=1 Tax=Streptomyces sp. NPDC012769 TaxID=3364848 RepID=UPI0036B95536
MTGQPPPLTSRRAPTAAMTVLALLAALLALVPWQAPPATASPVACPHFLVIGARGSGETKSDFYDTGKRVGGVLRTTDQTLYEQGFRDRVDVVYEDLDYPAAPVPSGLSSLQAWFASEDNGVRTLTDRLNERMAACPQTVFGLVGYSQGAGVIHRTLTGLADPAKWNRIRAVLLLADPYRDGSASYNDDIFPQDGADARLIEGGAQGATRGLLGRDKGPALMSERIISVCINGDGICASLSGPYATPGDISDRALGAVQAGLGGAVHSSYDFCCRGVWIPQKYGAEFARLLMRGDPYRPLADCRPLQDVPSEAARRAVEAACSQVAAGTWYTWGGGHGPAPGATYGFVDVTDPERSKNDPYRKGFDCSGFVRWAWAQALGHDVMGQRTAAQEFALPATARFTPAQGTEPLRPGDLVFWGEPITHVAIYLGNGKIVEARESDTKMMVSDFSSHRRYAGAIRLSGQGGSGSHSTWGDGVNVRSAPARAATVVTTLVGPTSITVQCQKRGETVTAEGITNDVWSYLPEYQGWITNIYVKGAAWLEGVPACDGSQGGGARFSTWGDGVNVRPLPARSGTPVAVFTAPMSVAIQCQKRAETVTAEGLTNDVWSYLPDYKGWISNIFVRGAAWLEGVPACDGNQGGGSGRFTMWASGVNTRLWPGTAAPLGTVFAEPTQVTVSCQQHAETVTAEGVTNDAWSYLPDHRAWISNIYLQGPAWLDGVPPCGSSGAPVGNTGHHMWASDVKVRADASTSTAVVHVLAAPTTVRVLCQDRGQSVTAEGITNSAWSYLPDHKGWISNIFIQGAAWLDHVPACASRRPGDPPNVV